MLKVLRTDQSETTQALRDAIANHKRRICMQAPTGYGKTVLAASIVESARDRKKKVLYTVPSISLIDQTVEMFYSQKIYDVGVIQATHHMTDWSQPVQIASVQSLMKRTMPDYDFAMVDECHIWFAFYERWFLDEATRNKPLIGLSATPWRKGLGSWYDHFHRAATTQDMIDQGLLSPFKVYAPSHPDLSGVRTVAGDYHEGELSTAMQQGTLVGDTVETWLKLGEDRPTLCYAVDRAHAKHLQAQFKARGVPCGYIDAYTPDADKYSRKTGELIEGRKRVKDKFHDGRYKVVCNVGCLTVGIDWDVRCISMCRPTKSDMLFVQIVGRGLRNAPGKDDCLILDHSDNHLRLGLVTDVDASYTGLHEGKTPNHENRTDAIRLPKECPQCAYLKPPRLSKCPACGFVTQMVCGIVPDAGELRELKPKPKQKKPNAEWSTEQKARFFGELKSYAAQRGFKAGWAANKYHERFDVWPNAYKHAPLMPPSLQTLSWIKSRNIAWAKSRRRTDGQGLGG